jgi:hypothetical protein
MSFPVFDKAGDVPKGFEAAYEEREGKWHAKIPDTAKIEETLTKTRAERKDFEKAAKDASEKAADLQRQLDAKSATGADTDKKVSELLAKWELQRKADVEDAEKPLRERAEAAESKYRNIALHEKAKQAFIEAGGRPEKADDAVDHRTVRNALDLVDDRPVLKDEQGVVRPISLKDFWVKEFKAGNLEFFTGTKATGGGASGGASKTTTTSDGSAGDRVIANPLQMLKEANEANAA